MKIARCFLIFFISFVYFEPSLFFPILGEIRAAFIFCLLALIIGLMSGAKPQKAIQNRLFIILFLISVVGLFLSPFPYNNHNQYVFSHFYKAIAFYFLLNILITEQDYFVKFFYINLVLAFIICFFSILTVKLGIEQLKGGNLYRM